jgi:hypothetical protein
MAARKFRVSYDVSGSNGIFITRRGEEKSLIVTNQTAKLGNG